MIGVGIVGCGNISSIYAKNLAASVVGCADLDPSKAEMLAGQFGFRSFSGVEELLASPEVGLVLNLTTPLHHFGVSAAALKAGKHVYSEKPLATNVADAGSLLELARTGGRIVGCAPDTVLGAGVQTCRRLLDDGAIGGVATGFASMLCPGHEGWHPDPAFYYQAGGGPLWDMGPYYLTTLVWLLGPIAAVTASAATPRAERTVASGPLAGETIAVETPSTLALTLEFDCGALVPFLCSFDVPEHELPHIELHGQAGALRVPDPNGFGGTPRLRGAGEWRDVPLDPGPAENARGIGVKETIRAIQAGVTPRCSGELAFHVVEAMECALSSARDGSRVRLQSRPERPRAAPGGGW